MNLTEHFTLDEMTASQLAARLGLDNAAPPAVVEALRHLCETILEPAREALGPLRVSSGYRSPAVDDALPRAVANVRPSAHRFGYAADVVPVAVAKLTFARWVASTVDYDQVILEFGTIEEPAWVHVSAAPPGHACAARVRGEVLRILHGRGYEPARLV